MSPWVDTSSRRLYKAGSVAFPVTVRSAGPEATSAGELMVTDGGLAAVAGETPSNGRTAAIRATK